MPPQIIELSKQMQECADRCNECARVVEQTLAYCLEQGGDHVRPEHVQLMRDCIEISRTCGILCDRDSDRHQAVARACAEICEACAKDCASFEGDKTMQRCAEVCRECAETCRSMV
jgi:hypothetical protein